MLLHMWSCVRNRTDEHVQSLFKFTFILTLIAYDSLHGQLKDRKVIVEILPSLVLRLSMKVSDEAHLSIGRIAFSHGGSSCKHPDAQKAVRCCLPGRHPRNFARGMLIGFWVDSCFGMSVAYEQSLAGRAVETGPRPWRFDWFTRSRTDLACLWPLPSLAATTTTTSTRASSSLQGQQLALDKRVAHALPANQVALQPNAVYVLSKELGALWDPLLLIPASFLVAYRNASTFVARRASDADCQNPVSSFTLPTFQVLRNMAALDCFSGHI